jgi:tetratricopeptide (TPR) repeat protein
MIQFLMAWSSYSIEMEFEIDNAFEKGALPSSIIKAVNDAYELNMKGLDVLEKGNLDAALSFFDEALTILADYQDAQNNRGVVFYRKGNITTAKEIWEKISVKDPSYAVSSYNLGLLYSQERQPEAASRLYERALKANPKFVEALVRNGMAALQLGNRIKAVEQLEKAYRIAPDQQDAWLFYAYTKLESKDTAEALSVLKRHQDSAEALKMLGNIESTRKNNKKALEYYQKAASNSSDKTFLVNFANALYDDGNCREALKILEGYFSGSAPFHEDAYLIGGLASKDCGNNAAALKYFEDGCKQFPIDPILRHNLGQMYFKQKQFEKAETVWSDLSDSVQDPSVMYMRAIAIRQSGNLDLSEKYIKKALGLDDRSEFHDLLGVIYHQKKDDITAESEFKKALKINPENRSAQLNLALISRKGEDLGLAAAHFEKLLSTCNGDSCADLAFTLSIIYFHKSDISKAIGTLNAVPEKEKDERIYRHIALFYKELHQYDSAIKTLEYTMQHFVLETQTEYELAELYLMGGYFGKAAERFSALLPKWKQNPWRLYYQMGYSFMEQNELKKAKDCFENSIKSKQDNVAARGLLAFVQNRLGNAEEARLLWEKNLKADPDNPVLWINMGLSFEKDGKYSDALSYYQRAVMLKKGDNELQINIGNAYAGMEKYVDAINAYTLALSSSKRELAAYNIFIASRKKKDKERAEKSLAILQQEYPSSVFTQRVNAEMSLWKGDTATAIVLFDKISDKDPADYLSLAAVFAARGNSEKTKSYLQSVPPDNQWKNEVKQIEAQLAFKNGKYDDALSQLKSISDTSFAAQYNIALLSYNAGRYGEALQIAERLLGKAMGQDRGDCCRLAGNAAFSLKQWKKARQWYLQLSGIESNNSIVQYNLAVASYNLGEIQPAWKYYQTAKGMDKTILNKDIEARYVQSRGEGKKDSIVIDSVDIWYNEAVDLQNSGKDTAAEMIYKKVVAKKPDHSQAWNNLGALYGIKGDIDNAEQSYWKAIEKHHDVPETYINLINLYIELEEFSKARQWIIKGIGHNPDDEQLPLLREKVIEAEKAAKQRIGSEK